MARKERQVIVEDVLQATGGVTSLYLVSTNTIFSHSFEMGNVDRAAVSYCAISATSITSVNVTLVYEGGFQPPDTEGAEDVKWRSPALMSTVAAAVTTYGTWAHIALFTGNPSFIPLPYGRFRLQSNGWNSGSTVNIKLSKQVEG